MKNEDIEKRCSVPKKPSKEKKKHAWENDVHNHNSKYTKTSLSFSFSTTKETKQKQAQSNDNHTE